MVRSCNVVPCGIAVLNPHFGNQLPVEGYCSIANRTQLPLSFRHLLYIITSSSESGSVFTFHKFFTNFSQTSICIRNRFNYRPFALSKLIGELECLGGLIFKLTLIKFYCVRSCTDFQIFFYSQFLNMQCPLFDNNYCSI